MTEKKRLSLAILMAFVISTCLAFTGCSAQPAGTTSTGANATTASATASAQAKSSETWTILVYMCGSDLESKHGAASNNLAEIDDATTSDNVKVVVEAGGSKSWQNDTISKNKLTRLVKADDGLKIVEELDQANMADEATLESFIAWGKKNYPATHTALILWNHGSGSIEGICKDENYDDKSLKLTDVQKALKATAGSSKLDFIGADACLMGSIEMANVSSDFANYLVASEATEPVCGWSYTDLVNAIAANPSIDTSKLGSVICESFYENCSITGEEGDTTLSVIDLSKLAEAKAALDKAFADMKGSVSWQELKDAANKAMPFGSTATARDSNMFDLDSFLGALEGKSSSIADARAKVKACIVTEKNGKQYSSATGISAWFPLIITEEYQDELALFDMISPSASMTAVYADYLDGRTAAIRSGDEVQDEAA